MSVPQTVAKEPLGGQIKVKSRSKELRRFAALVLQFIGCTVVDLSFPGSFANMRELAVADGIIVANAIPETNKSENGLFILLLYLKNYDKRLAIYNLTQHWH
jgi:hypothetical protein